MIWLDAALRIAACATSVIATLQASSRGLYLLEHDAIGVMDGPSIRNESTALYELSLFFRHAVRLSMNDALYANVTVKDTSVHLLDTRPADGEPYCLSLKPAPYRNESLRDDRGSNGDRASVANGHRSSVDAFMDAQDATFLKDAGGNVSEETRPTVWRRLRKTPETASDAVSSAFRTVKRQAQELPQSVSNLSTRLRHRARGRASDSADDSNGQDSVGYDVHSSATDWDYHLAKRVRLDFNSSVTGGPRICEVSAYAPRTFEDLRRNFGVREIDYHYSLFDTGPFVSFQSNSKGAARVNGVFFFTRDGAYMIKTIRKEEVGALLNMLPKYHKYMKRYGRDSLLTRFCGMYSVRIKDSEDDMGTKQTIVVMNSVFPAEASKFVAERYDLKGSTVGREASEEEKRKSGRSAVLKDLDLSREVQLVKKAMQTQKRRPGAGFQSPGFGFRVGAAVKAALLSQLRKDVKLLIECQVMDYSLLVGVVLMDNDQVTLSPSEHQAVDTIDRHGLDKYSSVKDKDLHQKTDTELLLKLATPIRLLLSPITYLSRKAWQATRRASSSILTVPLPYYGAGHCVVDGGSLSRLYGTRRGQRAIYYMGLIDFLQPWTTRKVLERKLKGLMGQDTDAISCVTPEEYAVRFLKFLDENIS